MTPAFPLAPLSAIGILGGGQLGRMLALAAILAVPVVELAVLNEVGRAIGTGWTILALVALLKVWKPSDKFTSLVFLITNFYTLIIKMLLKKKNKNSPFEILKRAF